ncbi:MAG TPA: GNAT family protein [Anaerolineales bacterium]|nr:GNAT family protein [Anaerolineales bacterium]
MKIPERIETERLILRKPRMDDASVLFAAYMQDPEVTRYTTWRPHRQLQEAEDFIRNSIYAWEIGTRFPFVITLKGMDEPFGMIDLHVRGCTVGLGYVIARSHQGHGYATEATRAIITWALQQPTIYRVNASTDIENMASQKVLEKVGMLREGLLRKYIVHPNISDIPRDSYMYAITK